MAELLDYTRHVSDPYLGLQSAGLDDVAHDQEGIAPRTQHHPHLAHQSAGPIDHQWPLLDIEATPGLLFQRAMGKPGQFPDGPLLGLSKTPKAKKQSKK